MVKRTKAMLEEEISVLKYKTEELKKENRRLNIDKDYWFVQSEKYRISKNEDNNPKVLVDLEEMERDVIYFLEREKRIEMKKRLQDHYYGVEYF